jgi:hypothetical protein
MDGFKNSTKTQYSMGGAAYAKGGSVRGAAKVAKVMGEFKSGKLHSGSKTGPAVTNPKQATAIALSEARKAPVGLKHGGQPKVMPYDRLEGPEDARVMRERRPARPRAVDITKLRVYSDPDAAAPETALSRRLGALPSSRGEMDREERGIGSRILDVLPRGLRDTLGLKKGGLAAMPRGKKF